MIANRALLICAAIAMFANVSTANAVPIRTLPDLSMVTIWEQSSLPGGAQAFSFAPNSSALTTVLPNPLGGGNNDFVGIATEFYDAYYSNSDGTFNINGAFLTITAVFNSPAGGGGHNITAAVLDFASSPDEFANVVTSFVSLGANAALGTNPVTNAIDGNIQSAPILGSTVPQGPRLSLTLGFQSSSPVAVPLPASLPLFASGLAILSFFGWRRRRVASA